MSSAPRTMHSVTWVVLAGIVASATALVFSDVLRWQRSVFLIPYVLVSGVFLAAYFQRARIAPKELTNSLWPYGVVGALVACALISRNIFDQPASARPEGAALALTVLWVGVVYGSIDGLLLNVMPVLAVQGPGFVESGPSWQQRFGYGVASLAASILVVVAYHLGYAEFRGPALLGVILGNVIITSSYLLTGSPLAAVATHIFMHIAAVFRGMETMLQLPPHY